MKIDYLMPMRMEIEQGENMYHFNSDTELLGRFMQIHRNDTVLDIGTNNGALLLYAGYKNAGRLFGIDLFEEVIRLAEKNCMRYRFNAEFAAIHVQEFIHDPFDVVICNPPYFDTREEHLKNENIYIKAARHEEYLNMNDLFENTARLLKDSGRFYMIHRPSRLSEILRTADKWGMYPVRMRIAYAAADKPAKSVLLAFEKNKDSQLTIEEPVYLNDRSTFGWKGNPV